MSRNLIALTVCLLTATVAFSWIDTALFNTATNKARRRIEEMVGEYQLKYERAKAAVEHAKTRLETVHRAVAAERVAVRAIERNISAAQRDLDHAKTSLGNVNKLIAKGQPVVLVSGRRLSEPAARARIASLTAAITVASEKVSLLTRLRNGRRTRLEKMEELRLQAPVELQRLQQSLELLAAKLDLYERTREWADDDSTAELAASGIFDSAQDALEEAHHAVDQRLAEFEAVVDATLESAAISFGDGIGDQRGSEAGVWLEL